MESRVLTLIQKRSRIRFSKEFRRFLQQTALKDGSFQPGIDPAYKGYSDTQLSGIAAPTYVTLLSETFGWPLPYPEATKEFFYSSQKPDGAFYHKTGEMDPNSPLAKLYNTAQSLVALRVLGEKPKYDPMPVVEYFFEPKEFENLPLYTTSFFPYFYTAIGKRMPKEFDEKLRAYLKREQKEDGYLGNHVASTFHAAHYYRLVGAPTPKAKPMIERTLELQQKDGSWTGIHPPSWDVHAAFDALFILRQLGNPEDPRIAACYKKAVQWILSCRNEDGGFGHFPKYTSDIDAVYFQAGGLAQAGFLKMRDDLKNEEILGWGHAMIPGKHYSCL